MDWKGHAMFANTFPILTWWDNVLIYHIFICQSVRCMVSVSDDTQPLLYYFNDCWQNQFDKAKRANKQTKETLFKSWQWLTCVCVWATELVHTNLWSAVKFNHDFKKGKQRLQTGSSSLFPLKHKSANLDTNWPNHNTFIMDISL